VFTNRVIYGWFHSTIGGPIKLADDLAASIAVGATRSDVLQKLGAPSSKISGDFERFNYQLQSGGTLRLEFEDGRVMRIQRSN